APSGGGKFDCDIARVNKVKRFVDDGADFRTWPMAMNLDKIEMSKAVDQACGCHIADTAKIVSVNRIDVAAFELSRPTGHAVEHLIGTIKEVHRAQNKIEFVPMLLNPFPASRRVNGIIIEFNTGADF